MRKKPFFLRFLIPGTLVMLCLSLMLIASGCKEKKREISSKKRVEVAASKKQTKEVVREEPLDGMTFELEQVSVSDGDFSGPSQPRLLSRSGTVRRSQIKIDGIDYDVFLAPYRGTDFCLIPKNNPQNYPRWIGAEQLKSMHLIGEKYYSFNITPNGDKLLVRHYEGEFGIFEVLAGGRNIQEIGMQGSLRSRDAFSIAVGGELDEGWPAPVRSCQLPVGDYTPVYLQVTIGKVQVAISDNYYHLNSQNQVYRSHKSFHGIKIRQNQPYVLDFSAKPQVLIAKPDNDQRLRLGHELKFEAVLVDPKMDIMIRRLYDTTKKQKQEYVSPDGEKHTYERNLSLDPNVVITRANGQKVAEGVMPFG
ncbi:MAG: hypothetical protein H8D56_12670 [Planctomycetes bacterium]|nr:hypothetical protein [Planctomycetota bacterium]MBL7143840.1 hypothetical protein [Phycisphaerae bacterium]